MTERKQAALGYSFHASVGNVGDWESTVAAFRTVRAEHGRSGFATGADFSVKGGLHMG